MSQASTKLTQSKEEKDALSCKMQPLCLPATPQPRKWGPFLEIRSGNALTLFLHESGELGVSWMHLCLKGVVVMTGPQPVSLCDHTCHREPWGEVSHRRPHIKRSTFCSSANSQGQGRTGNKEMSTVRGQRRLAGSAHPAFVLGKQLVQKPVAAV